MVGLTMFVVSIAHVAPPTRIEFAVGAITWLPLLNVTAALFSICNTEPAPTLTRPVLFVNVEL